MMHRATIAKILERVPHARVEEIFHELKKDNPLLSIATVYRNLKTLQSQGIIFGFLHPDGSVRYELKNDQPHQHLICKDCGKVYEIKFAFLPQLAQRVRERAGFQIHEEYMAIVGKCLECVGGV